MASLANRVMLELRLSSRRQFTAVSLLLLLIMIVIAACGIGAVSIPIEKMIAAIYVSFSFSNEVVLTELESTVLYAIRLPRVLLAIAVGACLAISGAAMQALFRNPLADPGLLGVSSGAALFAVASIVLGQNLLTSAHQDLVPYLLPLSAFCGALLSTEFIYRLAQQRRELQVATLLLAGIAINALAGVGIGFMTYLSDDRELRAMTFWQMGSLGNASWDLLLVFIPLAAISLWLLLKLPRKLNLYLLGEVEASHLGVNVQRLKRLTIVATALGVGASVAIAGGIGFVGLVIPHCVRLMFGPDNRWVLPMSCILGAILMLSADIFARTLVAPAELPIGLVIATIGAPFFLILLQKQVRGGRL